MKNKPYKWTAEGAVKGVLYAEYSATFKLTSEALDMSVSIMRCVGYNPMKQGGNADRYLFVLDRKSQDFCWGFLFLIRRINMKLNTRRWRGCCYY